MANRFELSVNDRARARLRARELDGRIADLSRLVRAHGSDPDFGRSLVGWRRELMDSRLEREILTPRS